MGGVSWGTIAEWAGVVLSVWGGIAAITWACLRMFFVSRREFDQIKVKVAVQPSPAEVGKMKLDVDALFGRVRTLEEDIKDLPTAVEVTKMRGDMNVLTQKIESLADTIDRVERPLNLMIDAALRNAS